MKYKVWVSMLLTAMVMGSSVPQVHAQTLNLPRAIEVEKENFDTIKSLESKYKITYVNQVNNNEKRVQGINFLAEPVTIEGEALIPVPADIVRVLKFFDRMDINDADGGIKGLRFEWVGPEQQGDLKSKWRSDYQYQGRPENFIVEDGQYEGYSIKVKGTGKISEIILLQPNGVPVSYDTTAWSILGEDEPIKDVTVTVDTTHQLSLEGVTEFEEETFKRVYANPLGEPVGYEAADYFLDRNFLPGRQIVKFGPGLEKAYGDAEAPKLTADAEKPGYADYSYFDEHYKEDPESIEIFDEYYPEDLEYVICYDNWPSWTLENPQKDQNRGTPAQEHFDGAADLAGKYTAAYEEKTGGRGPKYIEVKNESSVVSEWAYHNSHPTESWDILADFHNQVADSIKSYSPDVKVGGPTSAWMALDVNNFALAKSQMRFMDQTKDSLDFYSHHFYEGKDLILNDTDNNYTGYLTGRLEADLDLIRNHMVLTDNVKPLIISETGTLHSGASDVDQWIKLKNFNAYMIRYMNRANEFEMVVPFFLPVTWWDTKSPSNLYTYNESGELGELTAQKYFLDMWEDYDGTFVPAQASNDKVFVNAVQENDSVYVAVNNLNPQRVNLDLSMIIGDNQIESIEQKRLYLELGELQYEEVAIDDLDDVMMAVEETSIFKINLKKVNDFEGVLYQKTFYGDQMIQSTGANDANFKIKTPTEALDNARLRVSFARNNGFQDADMSVNINGEVYTHDLEYTNKPDRFFGYVDFEVPAEVLKATNEISISIPQEGGQISTVALINQYNQ